jgi:hypothetical protein
LAIDKRISDWITVIIAWFNRRPMIIAARLAGDTKKRSITPRSISLTVPMPVKLEEKSADITTIPGVMKSI